jgi:tRNA (guanine-N7-)-methyltransferase
LCDAAFYSAEGWLADPSNDARYDGPLTQVAMMNDEPANAGRAVGPPYRHIRSFALRRGHVTQGQRRAVERLLPSIGVPYAPTLLDFEALFGRKAPTVLEIGFGMGETTAAIAAARPDVNFLGVEVFMAGVGALLKRIDEQKLANIRIVHHDAVEVVRDMIPRDSLAGIHVYFPDPWQKKRHHKRRLIAQPLVAILAARIAPGGYLHCATDWEDYALQMLEVLSAEPQLRNRHSGWAPGSANPVAERPPTKFHARGTNLGHVARDLIFVRI